jgi:NADH-quinone oxidoreductase subunit M
VLIGAWQAFPGYAILAGIGIVIGVAYALRALLKAFFAEASAHAPAEKHPFEPISAPEQLGAAILMATTLLIGLWPGLLLDLIIPSLQSPLMQPLWKGGAAR